MVRRLDTKEHGVDGEVLLYIGYRRISALPLPVRPWLLLARYSDRICISQLEELTKIVRDILTTHTNVLFLRNLYATGKSMTLMLAK
jgi:hypothetical protein